MIYTYEVDVRGEIETWHDAYIYGLWGNGDYWLRDMTIDRPYGRLIGVRDTLAAAIGLSDRVAWREYQIRSREGEIVRGWWRATAPPS